MNIKHYKSLHYVLIMLLMFAPLRSAFAMQFMACDMQASLVKTVNSSVIATPVSEHCRHMSVDAAAGDPAVYPAGYGAKSCCDGDAPCGSSCHIAVSASLFLQPADYSPAFINTDTLTTVSSALLVRELSPPSRPPLSLHS